MSSFVPLKVADNKAAWNGFRAIWISIMKLRRLKRVCHLHIGLLAVVEGREFVCSDILMVCQEKIYFTLRC